MRSIMTLTAAVLALAISGPSASAQFNSGGGTIGCDPGAPTHLVSATQCRLFFKEALYGPSANPYASAWGPGYAAAPIVRHRKVVHPAKARSVHKSSGTGN